MNKNSCRTYFYVICDEQRRAAVKEYLTGIACDIGESEHGFYIGFNDVYDVDVNVMIRVSLTSLFGKEEKLKTLQKLFGATATLEVVPYISKDGNYPRQILSLDNDIIEFLYKSGAGFDLDYYVI